MTDRQTVTIGRYERRPLTVEATQLLDDLGVHIAIVQWIRDNGGEAYVSPMNTYITIQTREGPMRADIGDWVVREPYPTDDRRFYPVKDEVFRKGYKVPEPGEVDLSTERCKRCGTLSRFVSVSFDSGYTRVPQCVPCGAVLPGITGHGSQSPAKDVGWQRRA